MQRARARSSTNGWSLFTAEQSAAGKTTYQTSCSSCHAADLGGRNEAPPLAGSNFMTAWGTRTVGDLVTYMQTAMPPGAPGSLGDAAYANIGAFVLESNGSVAGTQALTKASNNSHSLRRNGPHQPDGRRSSGLGSAGPHRIRHGEELRPGDG